MSISRLSGEGEREEECFGRVVAMNRRTTECRKKRATNKRSMISITWVSLTVRRLVRRRERSVNGRH